MLQNLNPLQLLRYAGLFTWAFMGAPLLLEFFPEGLSRNDVLLWRGAYFSFGLCYWLLTQPRRMAARRRWFDWGFLAWLTVSAIAIGHFSSSGLSGAFLMIVAGLLPWFMPVWVGVVWLLFQHAALVPVFSQVGFSWIEAGLQAVLFFGYSSFVFITSVVALRQMMARDEQRRLNSELRATRMLLAESSRLSERMRISRELHDLLGHHLTALSLNLEVAAHLSEGRAQNHVRQSQTLAKLLLSDVREAVSKLREDDSLDLRMALHTLIEAVPSLQVALDMDPALKISLPAHAQVLLRCAQEIITNAVRHGGASELTLRLHLDNATACLDARDNGRGADVVALGNGLRGMRERLAEFNGHIRFTTAPGEGFALSLRLPLEENP